jgi:CopG antitoxin of type II toxin-antitoxin system
MTESNTQLVKSRIPTFKSVEEEAEFWDTHDTTEFEDEWEEVTDVRFQAAQPKDGIWLRLDDDVLAALTRLAREQKTSPAVLARRWVLERLHATKP